MAIKLIRNQNKPAYDGGHSPHHSRHGRDVAGANPFHVTESKFPLFVQERISPPGRRALDGASLGSFQIAVLHTRSPSRTRLIHSMATVLVSFDL